MSNLSERENDCQGAEEVKENLHRPNGVVVFFKDSKKLID
jgi:hypothetical protein